MNRIGPELFASCFLNFVAERLAGAVGQIAIDGKTTRRSHDRGRGQAALHLVSAFADHPQPGPRAARGGGQIQ